MVSPACAAAYSSSVGLDEKTVSCSTSGEDDRGRARADGEDVVALAALVLLPAQLALRLHLLDAPLGFAGAP